VTFGFEGMTIVGENRGVRGPKIFIRLKEI
jgi:hypothetical protein